MDFNFDNGEILNIDKPVGLTSFRIVKKIRHWTNCKKVGHAGTLDPMASGVLLVCTGHATKQVSRLMIMEKEYLGVIELGKVTDTDDIEGKVIEQNQVPSFSKKDMLSILKSFTGEIDQIPPMYSAIRKNGQRLYKLARRGEIVPRESRKVRIYRIELLYWRNPFLNIRVNCSKGTYIRALARDIGEKLKTGGTLKALQRTRIGPYLLEDACTMEHFKEILCEKT